MRSPFASFPRRGLALAIVRRPVSSLARQDAHDMNGVADDVGRALLSAGDLQALVVSFRGGITRQPMKPVSPIVLPNTGGSLPVEGSG